MSGFFGGGGRTSYRGFQTNNRFSDGNTSPFAVLAAASIPANTLTTDGQAIRVTSNATVNPLGVSPAEIVMQVALNGGAFSDVMGPASFAPTGVPTFYTNFILQRAVEYSLGVPQGDSVTITGFTLSSDPAQPITLLGSSLLNGSDPQYPQTTDSFIVRVIWRDPALAGTFNWSNNNVNGSQDNVGLVEFINLGGTQ